MSNPWRRGELIGAAVLAGLGGLFVLVLLVAVALGAQLSHTQSPHARWFALGLLGLLGGMVTLFAISDRWDNRHAK